MESVREPDSVTPRRVIAALGGRHFLLAVGAGFVTTLLQMTGKLPPDGLIYRDVVIGTVGLYIGGSVGSNFARRGDGTG